MIPFAFFKNRKMSEIMLNPTTLCLKIIFLVRKQKKSIDRTFRQRRNKQVQKYTAANLLRIETE